MVWNIGQTFIHWIHKVMEMVVSRGAKKKQAYATNEWVIYR